jgi:hypothetical protein
MESGRWPDHSCREGLFPHHQDRYQPFYLGLMISAMRVWKKHYIDSGEIFMCQAPTSSFKIMFVPVLFASKIKLNTCTPLV